MKATLFYYTATGNSLWVARNLAESLGNAELKPLSARYLFAVAVNAGQVGNF